MSMHMSSKQLFIYIDKMDIWACIERDKYLDFSYGDPCYIGRGKTPKAAFADLKNRIKNNNWINLEGHDPRFPRINKLDKQTEDLIKKHPELKDWLNQNKDE